MISVICQPPSLKKSACAECPGLQTQTRQVSSYSAVAACVAMVLHLPTFVSFPAPVLKSSFVHNRRSTRPLSYAPRKPHQSIHACAASPAQYDIASLKDSIDAQLADASSAIEACEGLRDLDDIRVKYLGKKGSLTAIMKMVGKLPSEDRPKLGASVNVAKNQLQEIITEKKQFIEEEERKAQLDSEWIDVTMPGIRPIRSIGTIHPLTSTMDLAIDIFVDLGYDLIDDIKYNRDIETDYYCFEALNCPPDHPAREMQDTFYITPDQKTLLRTQTSSVQIRYMEDHKPPFYIIAPGRVYRRDTADATHSSTFHQIEILAVEEIGKLTLGGLRATVIHFLKKMLGDDIETRFRGSYFPFTEPSMEVDVFFRGKWLEVLGCGMVDPAVLENVGIDPEKYAGFAAGFGVERFAMVMHEITDIRDLYKNDYRFNSQFMIDQPMTDWAPFFADNEDKDDDDDDDLYEDCEFDVQEGWQDESETVSQNTE